MKMLTSRPHLRRPGAVVLATLTLAVLGTTFPTAAEALPGYQWVCSSSGSVIGSTIKLHDVPSGQPLITPLKPSECDYVARGETRVLYQGAKSYRVGYNHGKYSKDCRTNNNFIPWAKADVIYFKLYTTSSCINP